MAERADIEESIDDSVVSELEAFFDDEDADVPAADVADDEAEESEEAEGEDESEEEEPASDSELEESDDKPVTQAEETEEVQEEEVTASDSEQKVDEESQKQIAHEAFKRREAERKLREAEQKREAEHIERYLAEAKDDEDELAKRQLDVNTYTLKKERSEVLAEKLDLKMEKAVLELGLKNIDEATRNYVARRLDEFEATRVLKDQNGNIVQINGDVYQYLKEEMDSISQFRSIGAREQTKKKVAAQSRTIPRPTRTPKEKPVDDDMAAFTEEADRW